MPQKMRRRCMPEIIELSSTKISQKMKNKGWLNIEKLILKNGKIKTLHNDHHI